MQHFDQTRLPLTKAMQILKKKSKSKREKMLMKEGDRT